MLKINFYIIFMNISLIFCYVYIVSIFLICIIMKISKNKNFREEYCASIVKIGEILPIEGKDRIAKTMVNGLSIVIGKTEYNTGDVAVYVSNECVIHELFLHLNNMYDDKELNANKEERGYINNKGRVRLIRLGGVPSFGILLNPKSIALFLNESVESVTKFLESHVGEDFDEINGERFCHVYVPPTSNNGHGKQLTKEERLAKKLRRFKMLIEGSFRRHYDTQQLAKNIHRVDADTEVDISVKVHGTSAIFANILTNIPTPWYKRFWRKYITKKHEYDQKYNLVYSTRNVIKNEFINPNATLGYYSDDVWGYWAGKLEGLIPKDVCIYCEIAGFNPKGSNIQHSGSGVPFDYGCDNSATEKSKLLVYRVTKDNKELEIEDVIEFGQMLKEKLGDIVMDFPILYHGTLGALYPNIPIDESWHDNVLEALKNDVEHFGMEQDEPLCNNKVPREGFVLRICNDPVPEAFKLKCVKFFDDEKKKMDNGEVDAEMTEGYDAEEA